jgi:hypothetical protein
VYYLFVGILWQQRNSLAKSFGIIIGICLDTTPRRTEHHHYCVFLRFSTSPFCFPSSQGLSHFIVQFCFAYWTFATDHFLTSTDFCKACLVSGKSHNKDCIVSRRSRSSILKNISVLFFGCFIWRLGFLSFLIFFIFD